MRLLLALVLLTSASARAASCPAKGSLAPAFSFPLARGGRVARGDLLVKKRAAVVAFFRFDCIPCKAELPELQKLSQAWGDKVSVLLVHVGESEEKMLAFLEEQKLTLPAALDASEKASRERYCVNGLPRLLVLDGKGAVVADFEGAQPQFAAALRAVVDPLLR